jgi:hypothetical protein
MDERASAAPSRSVTARRARIIAHGRLLRKMIAKAVQCFESALAATIEASVGQTLLERWRASLIGEHGSGLTVQTRATPTRHSIRSIEQVFERIEPLYSLDVHNQLANVPVAQLRRYARRLASRAPAAGARIKDPDFFTSVASSPGLTGGKVLTLTTVSHD